MDPIENTFTGLSISKKNETLLAEAISELQTDQTKQVKEVIKSRLMEIKRLEALIEKAKADLAELLGRDEIEIIMLKGK